MLEHLLSRRWFIACVMVACASVVMAWRFSQWYPLHDLYPLYYGGLAWRTVGNAYNLRAVAPPSTYDTSMLTIGNAYPLPAVLLTLPLTWLPPKLAATIWMGVLTAGIVLGLRLNRASLLFCCYLPIADSVRIEQYTAVIFIAQLYGLWAYRVQKPWLLALCCVVMTTKPTQGIVLALVLALLARNWRQQFVVAGIVWGGSLLLDPWWVGEWRMAMQIYQLRIHWTAQVWVALLAIPFLLLRDWVSAAVIAQMGLLPFQGTYQSISTPISVVHDRLSIWLVVLSFLWPVPAVLLGEAWGTALTLILPVFALLCYRRWKPSNVLEAESRQPGDHAVG